MKPAVFVRDVANSFTIREQNKNTAALRQIGLLISFKFGESR
jgi:hypothetical protein